MKTNIEIDDVIMQKVIEVDGIKTKKEVVELALVELIQQRARKDLSVLRGKIQFAEDYDYKALREER